MVLRNFKGSYHPVPVRGQSGTCLRLEAQPQLEGGFVPGSMCLLAGAQQGRRGCRLLVEFALAPQLCSPSLPACADEHPPYRKLSPECGRC